MQNNLHHARQVRKTQDEHIRHLNSTISDLRREVSSRDEREAAITSEVQNFVNDVVKNVKNLMLNDEISGHIANKKDMSATIDDVDKGEVYDDDMNEVERQRKRLGNAMGHLLFLVSKVSNSKEVEHRITEANLQLEHTKYELHQTMERQHVAKEELDTLTMSIDKAQRQYKDARDKLHVIDADVARAEERQIALGEELASMQSHLEAQELATSKSMDASKRANEQLKLYKGKIEELMSEMDRCDKSVASKESEIHMATMKLQKIEEETRNAKQRWQLELTDIETEKEKARSLMEESRNLMKHVQEEKVFVNNQHALLSAREDDLHERETQIRTADEEYAKMQAILDERAKELEMEDEQMKILQGQIFQMQSVQMETEQVQETMAAELDERERELTKFEKDLKATTLSIEQQRRKLVSNEEQLDNRQKELDDMETEVHEQALALKRAEEAVQRTRDTLDASIQQTRENEKSLSGLEMKLKSEGEKLNENRLELEQKNSSHQELVKVFEVEKGKLSKQIQKLKEDREEWEKETYEREKVLDDEKNRQSQHADELTALEDAIKVRLEETVTRTNELSKHEVMLTNRLKELDEREVQIATRERTLGSALQSRSVEEGRWQQHISEAKVELDLVRGQIEEGKRKLATAEDEYRRISSDARTIRATLKSKLSSSEKQLELLKNRRDTLKEDSTRLSLESTAKQKEVLCLDRSLVEVQEKVCIQFDDLL